MSTQIQNALGILSSEVPTGNLLCVDAVNGVDKLARRGRLTIPFRKLAAARDAAEAGDTIIVLPGDYVDSNLAKNGVNWHSINGAKVTHPGASLFYVTSSMTFNVTGEGAFESTNGIALDIQSNGAVIFFKGKSMSGGDEAPIYLSSNFRVIVELDSLSATNAPCVIVTGGTLSLRARSLKSDGAGCVYLIGGVVEIDAYQIMSDGGNGIYSSNSTARIRAFEVISNTAPAVLFDSEGTGRLTIQNARLVSEWDDTEGRAVYASGGSGGLTLHSCVLIAHLSAERSIDAASYPFVVQIHGACTANRPKGSNIVTIPITQGPNMFSRGDSVT